MGEIINFYSDARTARIASKYGPGPRIHYHGGWQCRRLFPEATPEQHRQELLVSQDRLVEKIFELLPTIRKDQRVLDVGCGLGGTSISIAQRYGCTVVPLTPIQRHAELVKLYAKVARVADAVHPVVGDAQTDRFEGIDLVLSIEALCHMNVREVYANLFASLRPGGSAVIIDWIAEDHEATDRINSYYCTSLSSREEHLTAAAHAGFRLVGLREWGRETANFYRVSADWSDATISASDPDDSERARLLLSADSHRYMADAFEEGRTSYFAFTFVKP